MGEDIPIPAGEEVKIFKQFLAQYDGPAFVRRGQRVQEAYDNLVRRCREQREQWLELVRLFLKMVLELAGDAIQAMPEVRKLAVMVEVSIPAEKISPSPRQLRRSLLDLHESVDFFNRRWQKYLSTLELTPVNRAREDYNRYYVLEKECALRSPRLARQGFSPLPPVTHEELALLFPCLPEIPPP